MKEYEVLYIAQELSNRSAKSGDICVIKPKGWKWGNKEGLPRFSIAFIMLNDEEEGDKEEFSEIIKNYKYDFISGLFVHKETGEKFTNDGVIKRQEHIRSEDAKISERIANKLAGYKVEDGCAYLTPQHSGGDSVQERKYWIRKFIGYKNENGMRKVIASVKFGNAGEIVKAIDDLPEETKEILRVSKVLSDKDKNMLMNKWKVI